MSYFLMGVAAMSALALGSAVRNIGMVKSNTEAIDDILIAMLDKEA